MRDKEQERQGEGEKGRGREWKAERARWGENG